MGPELRPLREWRRPSGLRSDVWRQLAELLLSDGLAADRPTGALWVPGRVELFGKHTDYAGGRSLVTAIDRGMRLLVAPREDSMVRWRDLGRDIEVSFDIARPGQAPGHWSNYLRTPARRVAADFAPFVRGVDVAMRSDLPAAAGLSSSSALLVAAYLAFEMAADGPPTGWDDRQRLAAYLGAVENGAAFEGSQGGEGVGTFGGSEDQTAILCGAESEVLQATFAPLEIERRVSWPEDWRLAVGVSGVQAKKTGGAMEAFNRLATLASGAAAAYGSSRGGEPLHLGAALADAGDPRSLERAVSDGAEREREEPLALRARHFALETTELVPEAAAAIERADAATLGRLAIRSQQAAETLLGNQVPATSALARLAVSHGAHGATAFGGGFGGAVWALVDAEESAAFVARWRSAYGAAFPENRGAVSFFVTAPAAGAHWLRPEESTRRSGVRAETPGE